MSILRARTQLEKSRNRLESKMEHIAEKAKVDTAIVQIELDQVNKAIESLSVDSIKVA